MTLKIRSNFFGQMLATLAVISLLGASAISAAADEKVQLAKSDVGVQLFMWNWNSVAKECASNLGPNGIDWVLVMPPQEHVVGAEWWVHYQPVSYKIESRLGSRAEFAAMVSACKNAGVKVVADVVINHMAARDASIGWAGTATDKYEYPGLYSDADFHQTKVGIKNWSDLNEVQNYQLLGLPDLDTSRSSVQNKIAAYLNDLLSLGVYGFRVDAARHIAAADLLLIKAKVGAAYWISEVANDLNPDISEYYPLGDVWEFSWATAMAELFRMPGDASYLAQDMRDLSTYSPSESAVSMVTNHDTERSGDSLTTDYAKGFDLATIFTLAHPYAKPMLYSGFAPETYDSPPARKATGEIVDVNCKSVAPKKIYGANEWACQHRWNSVSGMIAFRDSTLDAKLTDLRSSKGIASLGREAKGHLVINSNSKSTKVKVKTRMKPGVYCDLVSGTRAANAVSKKCRGKTVSVDKSGYINFTLTPQTALAISVDSLRK